ncbi:hypothetical protein V6N11_049128 [Hibiscus sabdariffa]|uniref:Uncharacterized protein n=2 Tax=Hibiscus sabdariffa TaxID=183260 RepID=A0ABR2A0C1_9ROSI
MAPTSSGVVRPLTTTSLPTPKFGSTSGSVMAREEWNLAGRRGSKRGGQCGQRTGLTFSFCQCLSTSFESSF